MKYIFNTAILTTLLATAHARMSIISPCPRYNPNGENCPALPAGQSWDHDIDIPIGSSGASSAPLCIHQTPFDTPSATWTAGQSVTVKFKPDGVAHGGGHCQFSLSYDGGKTFVVVYEVLQHCFFAGASTENNPAITSYTFSLPAELPSSDKAVFAWTWVNALGNRDFYMNCADVAIKGTSGSYTGKEMTIANYSGYPTIDQFTDGSTAGLEYYNKKDITVIGNDGLAVEGAPAAANVAVSSAPAPVPTEISVLAEAKNILNSTNAFVKTPLLLLGVRNVPVARAAVVGNTGSIINGIVQKTSSAIKNLAHANSGCAIGTFRCSSTANYDTCINNVWVSRPCTPGTTCQILAGNPNPC